MQSRYKDWKSAFTSCDYKILRAIQNMIDGVSNGIVARCLQDNASYEKMAPEIQKAVATEDTEIIEKVVRQIQSTLYSPNTRPTCKLLALRLTKCLLITGSYWCMLLLQVLILPWLVEISCFSHESSIEQRSQMLFGEMAKALNTPEPIQAGKSLLRMALEYIKALAMWVPQAPYQQQQLPTLFKVNYDRMLNSGIKFGQTAIYCKQGEKQAYLEAMNTKDSGKVVKTLKDGIRKKVFQAVKEGGKQGKALLQGLFYTGDTNIISTAVDTCTEIIKTNDKLLLPALTFADSIVLTGDPQAIFQIRTKIVPFLLQLCLTKPQLKERALISIAINSHFTGELVQNQLPTNRRIYEVLSPLIGNTQKLGKLFGNMSHQCIEIRRIKWPKWTGTSPEEQFFINSLELLLNQRQEQIKLPSRNESFVKDNWQEQDHVNLSPPVLTQPPQHMSASTTKQFQGIGTLTESINPQKAQRHWALSQTPSQQEFQLHKCSESISQNSKTSQEGKQMRESQIKKLVNSHSRLSRSIYSSKISERNSKQNSKKGSMISLQQISRQPTSEPDHKLYVQFNEYAQQNDDDKNQQEQLDIVEALRGLTDKNHMNDNKLIFQREVDAVSEHLLKIEYSKMSFNDSLFMPRYSSAILNGIKKFQGLDSASTDQSSVAMPSSSWKPKFTFPQNLKYGSSNIVYQRYQQVNPKQTGQIEKKVVYSTEQFNSMRIRKIKSTKSLSSRLLMPEIPEF